MAQPTITNTVPLAGVSNGQLVSLQNGTFANIWQGSDIFAKLLTPLGASTGGTFTVNTTTAGAQGWDTGRIAAPLAGGGFVVVWSDPFTLNLTPAGIKAQMFSASGSKVGGEITVRGATTPLYQDFSVVGLADGGFAVSWDTSIGAGATPGVAGYTNVGMRIFNVDGTPRTAGFFAPGGTAGEESFNALAQLANSSIVIGYSDDDSVTFGLVDQFGVFLSGSLRSIPVFHTGPNAGNGLNDIAALRDGGYVAVLEDHDDISHFVRVQIFDQNGGFVGAAFNVSSGGFVNDWARVIALPDGGFFIAWDERVSQNSHIGDIYGARYTSAGVIDGAVFKIAGDGTRDTVVQSLALTSDGRIAVYWEGSLNGSTHSSNITFLDPRSTGVTLFGGNAAEDWLGSETADVLVTAGGNDNATLGAGNDYLYAGDGDDTGDGGAGVDVLLGEAGNDTLSGGADQDYLFGGDGADTLNGDAGVDVLLAGAGNDTMNGGADGDYFYGEDGDDTGNGGDGNDIFVMTAGNDTANGDDGQDYFYMGDGDDTMNGGAGVDVMLGEGGNDTFNGGLGVDYLFLGPQGAGDNDTVIIDKVNTGVQVVFSFEAGGANDTIRLTGTGWTNFQQVQAAITDYTASGGFCVLTLDADTSVWLIGVQPSQLTAADFAFA